MARVLIFVEKIDGQLDPRRPKVMLGQNRPEPGRARTMAQLTPVLARQQDRRG